ncbi:MAG: ChbG/HpnK family deacetylase [Oligoflexia bacterium]|nr:ChbG/HpnK family deacetylase [Oligoflexia bacterium]
MSAKSPTSAPTALPHPRWPRLVAGLALALAGAALPLYGAKVWLKTDYTDFSVYYRAAERSRDGLWDRVYTLADGSSPFRYAPLTLPLFRPFAELSAPYARLSWYFLQFAFFALGFALLHRALKLQRARHPGALTALTLLFVFRLCLDCFTIGQVSSLLFLAFCGALLCWATARPRSAGVSLAIPTVFKIGPGFLYFLFFAGRARSLRQAWLAPIATIAGLALLSALWLKAAGADPWELWRSWAMIVAADSQYYDASHYGSQSLKSALLRLANSGALALPVALGLYGALAALTCLAIAAFWILRRPRGISGRMYFFALGLFPYLWFMPETFKYSLTLLAIPVALLLGATLGRTPPRRDRLALFSLGFTALTLSLPGKDLIPDTLFFAIQKSSLPFLATVLLAAGIARHARRLSRPSAAARAVAEALWPKPPGPWSTLPREPDRELSLLLPQPADEARARDPVTMRDVVGSYERYFKDRGIDAEILAVEAPTRALALREGFLRSRGRMILFGDPEQPCEPEFYERALALLRGDRVALVRASRRDPRSRFQVPVRLLELVYGRHRLGLGFNRLVRLLLGIGVQDTHSGSLALTRKLAHRAFALQAEGGFLFELELSLIAREAGASEAELPVTIRLREEKRLRRMVQETLAIASGIPRLTRRTARGHYRAPETPLGKLWISADDWGISPAVNEGILELARRGVVRRASAMAHSRFLSTHLTELMRLPSFALGLHFDLTHGKTSPGRILLRWLNPLSDRARLIEDARAEFRLQLQKLSQAGIRPAYLDGHHHIHVVPGLLEAIAPLALAAGIRVIRVPLERAHWRGPKLPLLLLSLRLRARARKLGFEFLPCHYPALSFFEDQGRLRATLARHLGHEIIVHPATRADFAEFAIPDEYSEGRVVEFRALRMLGALEPDSREGAP